MPTNELVGDGEYFAAEITHSAYSFPTERSNLIHFLLKFLPLLLKLLLHFLLKCHLLFSEYVLKL